MKTITIASTKGGSGKSTIISALAVRAAQETPKVAMMDLNFDQGSLTQWWHVRGKPQSPFLVQNVESIPRDVRVIAAMGNEWLFIDSPPTGMDLVEQAIVVADAVIVPVRPGFFDVIAVQTVTWMCRQHRKPFRVRPLRGGWPLQDAHQANARGAFRSWAGAQDANQLPAPMDRGAGHRQDRAGTRQGLAAGNRRPLGRS